MKKSVLLVLVFAFILVMTGCKNNAEQGITGKAYIYEKGGFSGIKGDKFVIVINEDGTFNYSEGSASSHLAIAEKCSWSLENGILTLTEKQYNNDDLVNHFKVGKDSLIFQEENSTGFIYTKVKDGEKFNLDKER